MFFVVTAFPLLTTKDTKMNKGLELERMPDREIESSRFAEVRLGLGR